MMSKLVLVLAVAILASALLPVVAMASPAEATTASGSAYQKLNAKGTGVVGKPVAVSGVSVKLVNRANGLYQVVSGAYTGWYMKASGMSMSTSAATPTVKPQTDSGYNIGLNAYLFYQGMVNGNWSAGR